MQSNSCGKIVPEYSQKQPKAILALSWPILASSWPNLALSWRIWRAQSGQLRPSWHHLGSNFRSPTKSHHNPRQAPLDRSTRFSCPRCLRHPSKTFRNACLKRHKVFHCFLQSNLCGKIVPESSQKQSKTFQARPGWDLFPPLPSHWTRLCRRPSPFLPGLSVYPSSGSFFFEKNLDPSWRQDGAQDRQLGQNHPSCTHLGHTLGSPSKTPE